MDAAHNYSHGYGGTGLANVQQHQIPAVHQQPPPQQHAPQNVPAPQPQQHVSQNVPPPQQHTSQNVSAPQQQNATQNVPPPQQHNLQNFQTSQQPAPQQPAPQQHQPAPQQHQPAPQQHQPAPQQHQPAPQQYQQPQGYEQYSHPKIQSPVQNGGGPMGDYYLKQQQNFYRNQAYEPRIEPNGDKSTYDTLSQYSIHTGKKHGHGHTHAEAYIHRERGFKDYFMKTQVDEFGTEHSSISKSKFAVAMAIGSAAIYATKKGVDRFREYRAEKHAFQLDDYPHSGTNTRPTSCSNSQHGYDPYN